jgi:hypothetical protein
MAIKANFPDIKPSLNLDFANTKRLDPRITFTRASTATYYDGNTVAKAEENLLLRSQEFDNAYWTSTSVNGARNVTVSADQTTSPNGTTTADKIIGANTTSLKDLIKGWNRAPGSLVAGTYSFSMYFKKDNHDYVALYLSDAGNGGNGHVVFDLANGTVTQTGGSYYSSSSIQDVFGDGTWYRANAVFSLSATNVAMTCGVCFVPNATGNTFSNFGGGTTSSTAPDVAVFVWGAQLEQRSALTDYTPTTTQPITNYVPALQTAASGEARFDHDPLTGESLGFLIEEQRTNLLQRSEEFDNAYWGKTRSSITPNIVVAPDGTLTGDKLVEDTTASNTHSTFLAAAVTVAANTAHTVTAFFKAGERTRCGLNMFNSAFTNGVRSDINLSAGTVTTEILGTATSVSTSISSVGNGWFRVSVTAIVDNSSTAINVQISLRDASGNASYTGDGYSGVYIWGAQLEVGAFPTSYIPTTTATVTRAADAASMTGTNFSSWYRQDEGTLYAQASALSGRSVFSGRYYEANDGTNNNRIASATLNAFVTYQGGPQFNVNPTATASDKTALAYKVNDFAFSLNGATALTDTSGNIPAVTFFAIGSNAPNAGGQANGYIKKLAYYPARLTNAELQGLTS